MVTILAVIALPGRGIIAEAMEKGTGFYFCFSLTRKTVYDILNLSQFSSRRGQNKIKETECIQEWQS